MIQMFFDYQIDNIQFIFQYDRYYIFLQEIIMKNKNIIN